LLKDGKISEIKNVPHMPVPTVAPAIIVPPKQTVVEVGKKYYIKARNGGHFVTLRHGDTFTQNGSYALMAPQNGNPSQQFIFAAAKGNPTKDKLEHIEWHIQFTHSGKLFTVCEKDKRTVNQWENTPTLDAKGFNRWRLKDNGNGFLIFLNISNNHALDVENRATAASTSAIVFRRHDGVNQQFILLPC
jgi:hypothetical protein